MSRQYIHLPGNLLDQATDIITAFSGSWVFLLLHVIWFGLWIWLRVEPFPFGLLTMMVSLEAIFLSTLVMMSQNRQASKDRVRDDHEAQEVEELFKMHSLLLEMNRRQLAILQLLEPKQEGMIHEPGP